MKTLSLLVSVLVALFSTLEVMGGDFANDASLKQKLKHLNEFERQLILNSQQEIAQFSSKKVQLAQSSYPIILPAELPIGSLQKVLDYSARESETLTLTVYQQLPGQKVHYSKSIALDRIHFSTFEQYHEFMQVKLKPLAEDSLTNSLVIKDQPLKVFGWTMNFYADRGVVSQFLYVSNPFSLVKQPDGSYELPDLSSYTLGLYSTVTLTLPRAKWIRTEVETGTSPDLMVSDSRINDGATFAVPNIEDQTLELSTELATGTNGGFHVHKIYAVAFSNNKYTRYIYGPQGEVTPEEPTRITNINCTSGNTTLEVVGETGRMGKLMESQNPSGPWVDTGTNVVIRPFGKIQHVQRPQSGTNAFYQIRLLDSIAPWTQ